MNVGVCPNADVGVGDVVAEAVVAINACMIMPNTLSVTVVTCTFIASDQGCKAIVQVQKPTSKAHPADIVQPNGFHLDQPCRGGLRWRIPSRVTRVQLSLKESECFRVTLTGSAAGGLAVVQFPVSPGWMPAVLPSSSLLRQNEPNGRLTATATACFTSGIVIAGKISTTLYIPPGTRTRMKVEGAAILEGQGSKAGLEVPARRPSNQNAAGPPYLSRGRNRGTSTLWETKTFVFPVESFFHFLSAAQLQGFKLGSASGHMRRTLVPSHEGHNEQFHRSLTVALRAAPRY